MAEEITNVDASIKKLQSFNSPWSLIKKAFSSILILLLIGSGLLINWILGGIYIFGWFSGTGWFMYIFAIIMMLVAFPLAYFFSAYWYGQSLLFWELYREVIRPLAAKIFSNTLDKILKEEKESGKEKTESEIIAELDKRSKHIVEKLPDFIRAYFQVFITGKDIVKIIIKQRATGSEKEAVKNKAMISMFEALDLQMAELLEPSMLYFYIVGAVNIVTLYFIF